MVGIGNRMKAIRENLGLTQDSIAQRLKVDKATYNRFEKENREPKLCFLEQFIEVTGANANYLIKGKGEMFLHNISEKENDSDIRSIYPDIPTDATVDNLIECLQVPLIYHLLVADFIQYRKQYKDNIDEHFLSQKEESHAASAEWRKKSS